ncbi:MAG: hypothetical protein JWL80_109 [Parcubacteria group bacterium]|nr:hypothetical protein [Parcubacteria group bacterium]
METMAPVQCMEFTVRTFGRSGERAVEVLWEAGYTVGKRAEQIVRTAQPTDGEVHKLVVIHAQSFLEGKPGYRLAPAMKMTQYAAEQEYIQPSVEDAWILREVVTDRWLKKHGDMSLLVMHPPVEIDGEKRVLTICRGIGMVLSDSEVTRLESTQYGYMIGLVYRVP